ncbi:hypothetical protein OAL32_03995 [Synechococcus sp. AH-551-G15]|nr:hypothetical protein [Synechococcus sp. AH-551-G15]
MPKRTPLAPLWYEVVADGYSHYYETLEEAQAEKESFYSLDVDAEDEIYRDSCLPLGSYFAGNPSLALKDWEDGKDTKYPLDNGVYLFNQESFFAIYKAANGPGSYFDEKGSV